MSNGIEETPNTHHHLGAMYRKTRLSVKKGHLVQARSNLSPELLPLTLSRAVQPPLAAGTRIPKKKKNKEKKSLGSQHLKLPNGRERWATSTSLAPVFPGSERNIVLTMGNG